MAYVHARGGAILPGNKCDDFVGRRSRESRRTTTLASHREMSLVSVECVCVSANSPHKADGCSTAPYFLPRESFGAKPFVKSTHNPNGSKPLARLPKRYVSDTPANEDFEKPLILGLSSKLSCFGGNEP